MLFVDAGNGRVGIGRVPTSQTFEVAGFSHFHSGAVFNEDSLDVDFRVESNNNANMLFVDGGENEVKIGSNFGMQSVAHLGVRQNGAAIEFGHNNNSAGFFGTLGSFGNNGHPYIGFSCASELSANTFSTFGHKGSLIKGDTSGNLIFAQVTTASATGQTPIEIARIGTSEMVINEDSYNYDFRVESNGKAYMFYIDGGNDAAFFGGSDKRGFVNIETPAVNYSSGVFNAPHIALQASSQPDDNDGFCRYYFCDF